jgi:hypothetical protein
VRGTWIWEIAGGLQGQWFTPSPHVGRSVCLRSDLIDGHGFTSVLTPCAARVGFGILRDYKAVPNDLRLANEKRSFCRNQGNLSRWEVHKRRRCRRNSHTLSHLPNSGLNGNGKTGTTFTHAPAPGRHARTPSPRARHRPRGVQLRTALSPIPTRR